MYFFPKVLGISVRILLSHANSNHSCRNFKTKGDFFSNKNDASQWGPYQNTSSSQSIKIKQSLLVHNELVKSPLPNNSIGCSSRQILHKESRCPFIPIPLSQ